MKTNLVKQVLDRLDIEFNPKTECGNAIFSTTNCPCGVGLQVWMSQETFRVIYLDSLDELLDLDKLILDIRNLRSTENE
jgi:hypothetical protein